MKWYYLIYETGLVEKFGTRDSAEAQAKHYHRTKTVILDEENMRQMCVGQVYANEDWREGEVQVDVLLLEACKETLKRLNNLEYESWILSYKRLLEQAIAKAEGREK